MFIILGADQKEYGPVTAHQIGEWIAEGRANLSTQARRPSESEWQTLGSFPEFGARVEIAPRVEDVPPPVLTQPIYAPGAAVTVEPISPLAPLPARFAAAFVDGLLKSLCFLPTTIPLYRFLGERSENGEILTFQEAFESTSQILNENLSKSVPFIIALIFVQMTLISLRGQSIGKLLLRLKIVRTPGEEPAGFLRGFAIRSVMPYIVQQLPLIGMVFWLVDTCFVFRTDRRCLHDLAAGTKVIVVPKSQD
jgi:uncharacterized RDD family membrane protein YckC